MRILKGPLIDATVLRLTVAFVIPLLLVSCGPSEGRLPRRPSPNDTANHLKQLSGDITQAFIEMTRTNGHVEVEQIVRGLARNDPKKLLSVADTNEWIRINPDARSWISPQDNRDGVAVYDPTRFQVEPTKSNVLIGVTFKGTPVFLDDPPF